MDQSIRADALSAREQLWKFETPKGPALVNNEYFVTTPKEWWNDPRSKDSTWKTDLIARNRLFVHRLTLSI
jgi:hypothetical protein